jgi:hypothetical protein
MMFLSLFFLLSLPFFSQSLSHSCEPLSLSLFPSLSSVSSSSSSSSSNVRSLFRYLKRTSSSLTLYTVFYDTNDCIGLPIDMTHEILTLPLDDTIETLNKERSYSLLDNNSSSDTHQNLFSFSSSFSSLSLNDPNSFLKTTSQQDQITVDKMVVSFTKSKHVHQQVTPNSLSIDKIQTNFSCQNPNHTCLHITMINTGKNEWNGVNLYYEYPNKVGGLNQSFSF